MGESALLGERRQEDSGVPAWSGEFWADDNDFGYMSVHLADKRTHRPPSDDNWRFVRCYASFEDDAQVFVYRKISDDCACTYQWDDDS